MSSQLNPEFIALTIVLGLDVVALRQIWRSLPRVGWQITWSAIVLVLPLLGFALWTLLGRLTLKRRAR